MGVASVKPKDYFMQIKVITRTLQDMNLVLESLKKAGYDNAGIIKSDGHKNWTVITTGKMVVDKIDRLK